MTVDSSSAFDDVEVRDHTQWLQPTAVEQLVTRAKGHVTNRLMQTGHIESTQFKANKLLTE